ncbi:MAG: YtxH domain-containing protein [Nitrospirota bacterium]|nr:YtxH domain-containing protein [Nitrospirota bacterium]
MREQGWSAMSVFLVGGLIGAGVALLLAPQSGPKLRRTLRDYAERGTVAVRQQGQHAWEAAVEQGKEYVKSGTAMVHQTGEAAQDLLDKGKDAVQEAAGGKQSGRGA